MNNSEIVRLKNVEQAVLELGKRVKDLELELKNKPKMEIIRARMETIKASKP